MRTAKSPPLAHAFARLGVFALSSLCITGSLRAQSPTPTPATSQTLVGYIPVAGSTPGSFGSFFRTTVQLLNPDASPASGRLVFHPQRVSGAPTDPSLDWSLAPGQTLSYDDVVAAMGLSGTLGSIDVFVTQGAVPVVVTRIFDDAGTAGTRGFTQPFYRTTDVPAGGAGFLIGPSDTSHFRYNLGVRTLDSAVTIDVTIRGSGGNVVHTLSRAFPANFFEQDPAKDFLAGFELANDESIELSFTGGGVIAYGATVDNTTNDPSAQFLSSTGSPQVAGAQTADIAPAVKARRPLAPLLLVAILAVVSIAVAGVVSRR